MIKEIYIDVDDVLNNFFPDLMDELGIPPELFPFDPSLGFDLFSHVNKHLPGRWHSAAEFWDSIPGDWWRHISKSDLCDRLVQACFDMVGPENVYVATSPTKCSQSMAAKHEWIRDNLPEPLHRQFFITPRKWCLGKPGALLIDDNQDNTARFCTRGGEVILRPRPWNCQHRLTSNSDDIVMLLLQVLNATR